MKTNPHIQTAVLAGGCFWCLEAAYQLVEGVKSVVSGYAGGTIPSPTYEQVSSGTTGHAECVQIEFDPEIITFTELLEMFWVIHDPTTPNRQGHDVGPQYRSAIFYQNDEQRREAEASLAEAQAEVNDPIVTEVKPLEYFYEAEAYHQNYFLNNPEQAYCQAIINPKLKKLRAKFSSRLKT